MTQSNESDFPQTLGAPVVELRQTCLACPEQWEGHLEDGQVVYVRYRHGHLTAGFGPPRCTMLSWPRASASSTPTRPMTGSAKIACSS